MKKSLLIACGVDHLGATIKLTLVIFSLQSIQEKEFDLQSFKPRLQEEVKEIERTFKDKFKERSVLIFELDSLDFDHSKSSSRVVDSTVSLILNQ